jgi:hypothetical protein
LTRGKLLLQVQSAVKPFNSTFSFFFN